MSCRHAQAELVKLLLTNSSSKANGSQRLAAAAACRLRPDQCVRLKRDLSPDAEACAPGQATARGPVVLDSAQQKNGRPHSVWHCLQVGSPETPCKSLLVLGLHLLVPSHVPAAAQQASLGCRASHLWYRVRACCCTSTRSHSAGQLTHHSSPLVASLQPPPGPWQGQVVTACNFAFCTCPPTPQ